VAYLSFPNRSKQEGVSKAFLVSVSVSAKNRKATATTPPQALSLGTRGITKFNLTSYFLKDKKALSYPRHKLWGVFVKN
jgi:hypothetical protein